MRPSEEELPGMPESKTSESQDRPAGEPEEGSGNRHLDDRRPVRQGDQSPEGEEEPIKTRHVAQIEIDHGLREPHDCRTTKSEGQPSGFPIPFSQQSGHGLQRYSEHAEEDGDTEPS